MTEEQNKQNLEDSRDNDKEGEKDKAGEKKPESPAKSTFSALKNPVKFAYSLIKQMELTDILFLIPFFLAMIKDLLDLVITLPIPAIGMAVMSIISWCTALTIWIFTTLLGGRGKKKLVMTVLRTLTNISGVVVESFFYGVNGLPLQTVVVVLIYLMVLWERSQAPQESAAETEEEGFEGEYAYE
ncbi:MAG: hypothetical protein NTZ97_02770 [Candidatus Moranbacteria bacterium]|nr:hypothetical protein [Candidatus Moranbacteria bacterium]